MKFKNAIVLFSSVFVLCCGKINGQKDNEKYFWNFLKNGYQQNDRSSNNVPLLNRDQNYLEDNIFALLRNHELTSTKDDVNDDVTSAATNKKPLEENDIVKRYMLRFTARYCMPYESCLRSRGRHRWFGCVCPGRSICRPSKWRGSQCW